MGRNNELYPSWLNIKSFDAYGGFRGMLESSQIGDNLMMVKEKFPDGWVFSVAPRGEAEVGILAMKGYIAVDNHDSMGALYNEKSGELVRAKFSFRNVIGKYDSYTDSLLTNGDLDLIRRMFEYDIDLNIEVELGPQPIIKISMVDYATGSLVDGRALDSTNIDPTAYGDI